VAAAIGLHSPMRIATRAICSRTGVAKPGLRFPSMRWANMFARREGGDPSLPPVFAGSHLDTQQLARNSTVQLKLGPRGQLVRTLDRAAMLNNARASRW